MSPSIPEDGQGWAASAGSLRGSLKWEDCNSPGDPSWRERGGWGKVICRWLNTNASVASHSCRLRPCCNRTLLRSLYGQSHLSPSVLPICKLAAINSGREPGVAAPTYLSHHCPLPQPLPWPSLAKVLTAPQSLHALGPHCSSVPDSHNTLILPLQLFWLDACFKGQTSPKPKWFNIVYHLPVKVWPIFCTVCIFSFKQHILLLQAHNQVKRETGENYKCTNENASVFL